MKSKTIATAAPAGTPPKPEIHAASLSPALRRFVYFTAGLTGGAIMIVEILGAKMLSPFLGTSHFVWTAQIAVTMVALATGYYVGGRVADRSRSLAPLYWAIMGAAVYLALTVLVREPVAYWCLKWKLAAGSLLASAILFFIPLGLLAMTGPFLLGFLTQSLKAVSSSMGRLTSISTLGSLGGTMLIGYVLIPLLPNSVTMYLTALLLLLVGVTYFAIFQRRGLVASVVVLAIGALPGFALPKLDRGEHQWLKELYRGNSHFGMLQVVQRPDGTKYFMNDFLVQDTYDPERKQSVSHFTYMLSGLAKAYNTNINDVLCIGLGIGIVPMEFASEGVRVDVVEINPAVVPLARDHFDFKPELVNVVIDDGRHFLNRCEKKYDAVVLDAFLGDSSPAHLFSREAFRSIQRVLRPDGVLVINSFGSLQEGKEFFSASMDKTLKSVFKSVRLFTGNDGGFFFAASDRPTAEFARRPNLEGVHPEVRRDAEATYAGVVTMIPDTGIILTDDYNPTEFHDSANREEFRRRMAYAARGL